MPKHAETRKRLPRYFYEARTLYFYQTLGWGGLLAANGYWFTGRALSLVRYLAQKPPHKAIIGEYRDIWANFFNTLKPSKAP